MKRIHIHLRVEDLKEAEHFYAALLGAPPTVAKPDYLKWMVDDPRINLAITQRCGETLGVEHLGIETDDAEELASLDAGLKSAGIETRPEAQAHCCYATSDKHWAKDGDGVIWELFQSHGRRETYGADHGPTGA
ncbi:MAG: VOC family protein [Pseudomonadota bacterium]